MKNNKFLKISLLILTIALCLGAVFATIAFAADEASKTPDISDYNIMYTDKFCLMYAVDAKTVAAGPVTLYVHTSEPADNNLATLTATTLKYTVNAATPAGNDDESTPDVIEGYGLGYDAYVFITDGVAAGSITKEFYVVAVDSANNASAVVRYSVAEYLLKRLATGGLEYGQRDLYEGSIQYAAGVQKTTGEKLAADSPKLISNLRYVTVVGGTVDGKYKSGVYPVGATVEPQADGVGGWNAVLYGAEGNQLDSVATGDINSYKIPETEGLLAVKFTTGNVITYHEGTIKFDDLTSVPSYITQTQSAVAATIENGVLKFTAPSTDNNQGLTFNLANMPCKESVATASEATAVEISFDIKVVHGNEDSDKQFIRFITRESSPIHRAEYKFVLDGATNPIQINGADKNTEGTYTTSKYNLDSTGWVNIRIVYYKGDTSTNANYGYMHIYVNGDTKNPLVLDKAYSGAYEGDLNIPVFNIWGAKADGHGTVYIDNFFYGYTDETLPQQ